MYSKCVYALGGQGDSPNECKTDAKINDDVQATIPEATAIYCIMAEMFTCAPTNKTAFTRSTRNPSIAQTNIIILFNLRGYRAQN
jgi:hypothetical protein